LLLEGMVSSCVVLTRPVGNVPAIYGESPFVIKGKKFVEQTLELIRRVRKSPGIIRSERERVEERAKELQFSQEAITRNFLEALK